MSETQDSIDEILVTLWDGACDFGSYEERVKLLAEAKAQLQQLLVKGRLDEAYRIGILQEQGKYLPATYLIDRREALESQLNKEKSV